MIHWEICPLGFLVGIVEQACEGIHFAHELCDSQGQSYRIVHRDLSPPNLLLSAQGVVKILDFGISKSTESVVQTATGQIRGKFTYMSPEQLRGQPLDQRSDVFSLGVILQELLTGARLFKRATRLETYRAISREEIPRANALRRDLPSALADVCARALARERDQRFASARHMANALRHAAGPIGGVWSTAAMAETMSAVFEPELIAQRQWLHDAEDGAFLSLDIAPDPTATVRDVSCQGDPPSLVHATQTQITAGLPRKPKSK